MELILKLNIEQVNAIMGALGEAPYKIAAPVINEIQMQAQAQMKPQLVPEEPANEAHDAGTA